MSLRKDRVEHALRDVLTSLIRTRVKDPRVKSVALLSISKVELNVDLSVATAYVSIVEGHAPKPGAASASNAKAAAVLAGLTKAAGYLRGPAARELNLAHPPELRFVWDRSSEMHELIESALRDDRAKASAAAAAAPCDEAPDDQAGDKRRGE